MIQRYRLDRQAAIIINRFRNCCVNRMLDDFKTQVVTEHALLHFKHRKEFFRCINMKRRYPPQQAERAYHSD